VWITAGDPAGAFYAAQTLRQLLPPAAYRAARTGRPAWTIGGIGWPVRREQSEAYQAEVAAELALRAGGAPPGLAPAAERPA
jgi:hypothetical protein